MVTQISLGSFFAANGRRVGSGVGGSGLDTESIIKALTEARAQPAKDLEEKVTKSGKVIEALGEFRTLLDKFQTSLNALRNPPGVGNAADNAFAYTAATLASNTTVAASTYLSVSVAPGTELQSYDVTYISSIAKATKQSSGTFTVATADTTGVVVSGVAPAGKFKAGTFTVNGEDITLDENDTLNSIAAKFNAVKGDTGISASVIKVADGQFKLNFSGTSTGTANDFDLKNAGTVTDPTGVLTQVTITTTQDAADAVFQLDGVTITRSTNAITDVVSGVTFNLLQVTPDDPLVPPPTPTTITVDIQPDTTTARNSIIDFLNAYNEIRTFAAKQMETQANGMYADTALLATNSLFRSTIDTVTSQVAGVVSNVTLDNFSDVGITFTKVPASEDAPEVTNVLTLDQSKLDAALASDFNNVRKLFEFTLTSTNPNLRVFSRTNALDVSEVTFTVNPFAAQSTAEITIADADTPIANATPDDYEFGLGVITVNGETITIADGDTLNQIAGKFNAVSATSGLAATVVNVSAGVFKMTFAATPQSGKNNLFDLTSETLDPDGVFDKLFMTSTGVFQATYDDNGSPVTIDVAGEALEDEDGNIYGFTLTGEEGTVLEGIELIYSSAAYASIDTVLTQGLADVLYNTSDSLLEPISGSLTLEVESIQENSDQLSAQIARINEQVDQYRELLIEKFSRLEQVIAGTNRLLQGLDANQRARENS